jgi:hypothetical protein
VVDEEESYSDAERNGSREREREMKRWDSTEEERGTLSLSRERIAGSEGSPWRPFDSATAIYLVSVSFSARLIKTACARNARAFTEIPVGMCVIRTALSVLFTCCPPGPELRVVSIFRSFSGMTIPRDVTQLCTCERDRKSNGGRVVRQNLDRYASSQRTLATQRRSQRRCVAYSAEILRQRQDLTA